MASPAQTLANQQNAQRSSGPKSTEGKAASSTNATKHGLSSAFTVLSHEDQDEFDVLLKLRREESKPATHHQRFLVDQLAKSEWLLARAQRLEAGAFEYLAGHAPDPVDPDTTIVARMFEMNPNALLSLQRYAAQAERSYHKAWRELAAAKQIQNEANYVAHLDGRACEAVAARAVNAPLPDHPAVGTATHTQYGYVPQETRQAARIHTAARAGDGALCY